ncbi:hypothetical protein MJ560_01425 [Klebsiella pneumoniae]|nr:hypothetical protein MJ560_01425 [Klebsiella pneumoniae]
MVETICQLLEELVPDKPQGVAHYRDSIAFAADRPGHDLCHALLMPFEDRPRAGLDAGRDFHLRYA